MPQTVYYPVTWLAPVAAGGVVVLAEEFCHDIYRKSLARLFEVDENGYLQMYFNANVDVIVSKVTSATCPPVFAVLAPCYAAHECSHFFCS